jgi:hypothetical protein
VSANRDLSGAYQLSSAHPTQLMNTEDDVIRLRALRYRYRLVKVRIKTLAKWVNSLESELLKMGHHVM